MDNGNIIEEPGATECAFGSEDYLIHYPICDYCSFENVVLEGYLKETTQDPERQDFQPPSPMVSVEEEQSEYKNPLPAFELPSKFHNEFHRCRWSFDEKTNVLLMDNTSNDAVPFQLHLENERFMLEALERYDIAVVVDGFVDVSFFNGSMSSLTGHVDQFYHRFLPLFLFRFEEIPD